jgi:uncharacterized membrane protein YfcA
MNDVLKLVLGTIVLFLGIPLGNFLARFTKEELKDGQLWFKLIIVISCLGATTSLIVKNDTLLFSFLFIAIVTSKSLVSRKRKNKSRKVNRKKIKK